MSVGPVNVIVQDCISLFNITALLNWSCHICGPPCLGGGTALHIPRQYGQERHVRVPECPEGDPPHEWAGQGHCEEGGGEQAGGEVRGTATTCPPGPNLSLGFCFLW